MSSLTRTGARLPTAAEMDAAEARTRRAMANPDLGPADRAAIAEQEMQAGSGLWLPELEHELEPAG
jgi:hypothetical protein